MDRKIKIIVVEDESVTALDISGKLTDMGYSVIAIVDNSEDVLEKVDEIESIIG